MTTRDGSKVIIYCVDNYQIPSRIIIIIISSSSSSSCSLRVRCVPCFLVLKVELVPPSLLRSSNVPSSGLGVKVRHGLRGYTDADM